jgi:hydrogenase maturation protein HypF
MAGLVAQGRRDQLNPAAVDTRRRATAGDMLHLTVGADRPALALGAWLKNTVCAIADGSAMVSGCVGDLDSVEACLAHEAAAAALLDWLDAHGRRPRLIAHDLHPDFHSSRHAALLGRQLGVPCLAVQHHHAHIAAICAEHALRDPVLGLALDGVGLGADHTHWGGELLRVDGAHCQRLGHLSHLPLPGADGRRP